jgi:hypothetical protein
MERAQALQKEATEIFLAEREQIDTHLALLGYGTLPSKKRGRPAKLS